MRTAEDILRAASKRTSCGWRGTIAGVFFLAAVSLCPASDANASEPLTSLKLVHALTPSEQAKTHAVKLQGTVTYCDPAWRLLFLQDGADSMYVGCGTMAEEMASKLQPGRVIALEGTALDATLRCTNPAQQIRVLGMGSMPEPFELASEAALSLPYETRWIKAKGWVADVSSVGDHLSLKLMVSSTRALFVTFRKADPAAAEQLRGWWIEVIGVLAPRVDAENKRTGEYLLFVSNLDQACRLKPVTPRQIRELTLNSGKGLLKEPVCVRGNVVTHHVGDFLLLQDDTGVLRVEFKTTTYIQPESRLQVLGYIVPGAHGLVLTNPLVLRLSALDTIDEPSGEAVHSPIAANPSLPVLTDILHVRSLSPEEAARAYPVQITAAVTYSDVVISKQFIQDDSAGIYLDLSQAKSSPRLSAGQRIQVKGFSGGGGYAPIVVAEEVRVVGDGPLPAPRPTSGQMLMTGAEDSQWISLRGVIRDQSSRSNQSVLVLYMGDVDLGVTVPQPAKLASASFIDATVEVRGVCSTLFDERRRLEGVELLVPDWSQIQVTEPAPADPFQRPVQLVNAVFQFHADTSGLHRARVQGSVILTQADGSFLLQDSTGGLQVRVREPAAPVDLGDLVDVVGFPVLTERTPGLQDALVKTLGHGAPVKPIPLDPESPPTEGLHATLVQMKARALGHSIHSAEEILTVQFGQRAIDVMLPRDGDEAKLAGVVPGSVVELTGVYMARLDDQRRIKGYQLYLRSPADVTLLFQPSWWTVRHTVWLLAGLIAVLAVSLGWVGMLRREVRERTRALREEIEERKRAEEQLKQAQSELLRTSRLAGMAEVATNVLHNVGNVLNSVNVSSSLIADGLKEFKISNLARAAALMREHEDDLGDFLANDPKGRQLPGYLDKLAAYLDRDRNVLMREADSLQKNVGHIKDIVAMQQNYAKVSGVAESVAVTELMEDALRMNAGALERHKIQVCREYAPSLPTLVIDKHKVLQILVNLVHNAKYACDELGRDDKRLTVRVGGGGGRVQISVIDNGIGIPAENLTRIFSYGFTTRKNGHGFGLHSGALAARELGGALRVQSEGPSRGATFTLDLPVNRDAKPPSDSAA